MLNKNVNYKLVAAFAAAFVFGGGLGWVLKDVVAPVEAPVKAKEIQAIRMQAVVDKLGEDPQPEYGTAMSQYAVSETVNMLEVIEQKAIENLPRWQRNAKPVALTEGYVKVAIVIDDVGVVAPNSEAVVRELPHTVTLAFLPYGDSTKALAKEAFNRGHEIMVHMPMQPKAHADGYMGDPGPNALFTKLSEQEVRQRTIENMAYLKQYAVGVNNHMGSAFTAWQEGMRYVLEEVEKEHLMFMDSITTADTKVFAAGEGLDLPLIKRSTFLDHSIDKGDIRAALEKTMRVAREQGYAIAIGHPHPETTAVLKEWVGTLEENKVQLVPISTLIK